MFRHRLSQTALCSHVTDNTSVISSWIGPPLKPRSFPCRGLDILKGKTVHFPHINMLTVGYNPTQIELPFGLTLSIVSWPFLYMSSAKRSKLIRPVQWTAKHKSTRCIFFSVINCPALGKELWLPAGFNVIQRAIAGDHQKLWWELSVVFISTGCKMSFKHLNWGNFCCSFPWHLSYILTQIMILQVSILLKFST